MSKSEIIGCGDRFIKLSKKAGLQFKHAQQEKERNEQLYVGRKMINWIKRRTRIPAIEECDGRSRILDASFQRMFDEQIEIFLDLIN